MFLNAFRRDRNYRNHDRARRQARPTVEGMESRKLLSAVVATPDSGNASADVFLIKHGWHDAD